jgi:glycosyltransferase involved in cell wall biosynthesis
MRGKIKVLHLIENLGRGGAELRLLEDVRNLTDFNHKVCYLFKNDNELENDFKKAGAETHCLYMHSPLDLWEGLIRLLRLIRGYKPHIIHSHLFWANIISRLSSIFSPSIDYVQTIHFPDYAKDGSFIYSRTRHYIEFITLFLKRPKFIAVSEYVKKESIKSLRLNEGEVTVIYNYLNDNWFSNVVTFTENNTKKILSVGRLHKQKGFEYLIKAMRIVLDSGREVFLSIVGDGPEMKSLMRLIKTLGLNKNVFLLGKRSEIQKLILESDIFVLPSVNEGLGIALIEAMSQGRICLAFNVGPIPEIIEDNVDGFLVSAKDVADLADKIIYVLDNFPHCRDIAENARFKAKTKFSRDSSVRQLRDYYNNILEGKL